MQVYDERFLGCNIHVHVQVQLLRVLLHTPVLVLADKREGL